MTRCILIFPLRQNKNMPSFFYIDFISVSRAQSLRPSLWGEGYALSLALVRYAHKRPRDRRK